MRADNEPLVDLDELASLLRQHEGPPHAQASAPDLRPRRTSRLRLGLAIAAVALLAGSGLGFGLASSITPEGKAGPSFSGLGFLPSRGWTIAQEGTVGPSGTATAIAANVPLRAEPTFRGLPLRTLASLPARGVLIHATFSTRGDPGEDVRFPEQRLPLDLAAAQPVPPEASPARLDPRVAHHRLRAGVSGYNVDARIFYGSPSPSRATLDAAQRQLGRLVVSAEQVSIFARPTIVGRPPGTTTLFGSVDNGQAGEVVDLQAKDCGQQFFRGVEGTTTAEGGRYSLDYFPGIRTTLRAVWKGTASAPVTVRHLANISMSRERGTKRTFNVGVAAKWSFWRKRVLVQQRRAGSWKTIRSVVLTEQHGGGPAVFVTYSARFKLTVRKGTLVRALIQPSQARPCYLSAASPIVRVTR